MDLGLLKFANTRTIKCVACLLVCTQKDRQMSALDCVAQFFQNGLWLSLILKYKAKWRSLYTSYTNLIALLLSLSIVRAANREDKHDTFVFTLLSWRGSSATALPWTGSCSRPSWTSSIGVGRCQSHIFVQVNSFVGRPRLCLSWLCLRQQSLFWQAAKN